MIELLVCHREDCDPVYESCHPQLVRCRGCGLSSPVGRTEEETRLGWNQEIDIRNDILFKYPNLGRKPKEPEVFDDTVKVSER